MGAISLNQKLRHFKVSFTLDLWLVSIFEENNFKLRTNVVKTCPFASNFQVCFLLFTRDLEK